MSTIKFLVFALPLVVLGLCAFVVLLVVLRWLWQGQWARALALAQDMVAGAHDTALPVAQRAFAYLPFMHSESLAIHSQALLLFDQPGLEGNLRFERLHQDILQRFGRYPHRNAALGRRSTPEEEAFLQQPGAGF